MKIMLIAPASGKWKKIGKSRFFNGKTFRFSLLSLLSVAAETPPDIEIKIVDEQVDDISWEEDADLVGITCMTALANRAYEISFEFRKRGIPVVLGGTHPSFCPEETLEHADAVVVGDAEVIWKKVIEDLRQGRLKGIYKNEFPVELKGLNPPPRELLKSDNYGTVQAAQATRGCNNGCDFCSVAAFHKQTQRQRPVSEVYDEISAISEKFFIFVDDNLTADRDYAKELFKALIPLKKKWITQSTLSIAEDEDLVRLAAKAGCIGLFVGLETFKKENLDSVNKNFNKVEQYREAIKLLHSCGIGVEAGIVFGFDNDTPDVFKNTLTTLDKLEVDVIQVSIFTPLPGTYRFKTMKNRIYDYDWSNYDFHNVVFSPEKMKANELKAGHDWVTNRFYSPLRIVKRLMKHIKRPGGFKTVYYVAALNLAYLGRVLHWNIKGYDPSKVKRKHNPLRKIYRKAIEVRST
jgi:radical SAM superfamily enzyme YgiQ (UPF0313 family)